MSGRHTGVVPDHCYSSYTLICPTYTNNRLYWNCLTIVSASVLRQTLQESVFIGRCPSCVVYLLHDITIHGEISQAFPLLSYTSNQVFEVVKTWEQGYCYYSFMFSVVIFQATYSSDLPCETVSKINLVDLAGRWVKGYTAHWIACQLPMQKLSCISMCHPLRMS